MSRTLYRNFVWALTGEPMEMLVEDGIVIAREPTVDFQAADQIDLRGECLMPRFVDAHCHILPTGLDLQKLHLGEANSHADVLDLVLRRHRLQSDGWLHAVHYDQNRYGGVHVDKDLLDSISPHRPILLRHVNGHASVANSAALAAAGVSESTADPTGGRFDRDASGRLTGVLLESAHELVTRAAPRPSREEMVEAILRAGELMYSEGIGCATDMMTGFFDLNDELDVYEEASAKGCPIRLRLFVQWKTALGKRAEPEILDRLAAYGGGRNNRSPKPSVAGDLRIAGIKIFADGAIGSRTAAIHGSYVDDRSSPRGEPDSAPKSNNWSGQLIYSPAKLHEMVRVADAAALPVAIHSIGDFSTDLVMDAFATTEDPKRHRIEHAMLLSDRQIERMKDLGIRCTFQPEFLRRFGQTYQRQLGKDRARNLVRVRSALDAGIPISFNSDRPIVAGNPWDGIHAAVRRPEGFDQAENCTLAEAIRAYTEGGAQANDDPFMGALSPGQVADFQTVASERFAES